MFQYKKSLGQNFLQSDTVTKRAAELTSIDGENCLEIGPGAGALTKHLISAKKLVLIEKDDRLVEELEDNYPLATIFNQDFLDFDLSLLGEEKFKVLSCIPYNITGPIIEKLIVNKHIFTEIVLIVQKEVAERAVAKEHNSNRSAFSVLIQLFGEVNLAFKIPREKFFPIPKVDSAAMHIKLNNRPFDREIINFVKSMFANKRKQLANNISHIIDKEKVSSILENIGADRRSRAEDLSISQIEQLYKKIFLEQL